MLAIVLHPASGAAATARRTVHGMDPGLRGDDLPLDAGQELLALGQAQSQGAQIGKGIRLGDPHDIGAVFFALSSDADQPHDPGHVASTSAGIQARKSLFRSRAPNLAAVPAYSAQPRIALWNLTRLAEAILPLLAEGESAAIEEAEAALAAFRPRFQQ